MRAIPDEKLNRIAASRGYCSIRRTGEYDKRIKKLWSGIQSGCWSSNNSLIVRFVVCWGWKRDILLSLHSFLWPGRGSDMTEAGWPPTSWIRLPRRWWGIEWHSGCWYIRPRQTGCDVFFSLRNEFILEHPTSHKAIETTQWGCTFITHLLFFL